jgi:WD40 repeat protein
VRGGENFRAVAFSPDSKLLATGDKGDAVTMFTAGTLQEGYRFTGHSEPPTALAFTPDGAYLTSAAGGVDDQSVRLWRTSDGQATLYGAGHRSPVKRLRFTEDGRTLLSASTDLFARWSVWPEVGGGMPLLQTLVGFGWGFPSLLEVAPDGVQVADGWDAILRLGSFVAPATLTQMPSQGVVSAITFAPDSKSLAAGEASGVIRIWTAGTTNVAAILTGHTDKVSALAYSPEGHWLASGSHDRTVRIWNLLNASSRTLLGHGSIIHAVYFSQDGTRVASVSSDKTIRFWNLTDGHQYWGVTNDVNDVTAVALSPDWKTLAAWGDAKTLRVWQVGESVAPQVFDQECVGITTLAFSPNSRWLAYSRQDASLFLAHNPILAPTLRFTTGSLTEAGFTLQLNVQPDWPVTVQVSDDLVVWQSLTNLVPGTTVVPLLDAEAGHRAQRFYRALR